MRIFTLTGIVFACFSIGLRAQAPDPAAPAFNTNKIELKLSLDECVRQALVQNLSIQISRASPEIARYVLSGSYGYYDPVFNGRGGRSYNERPGRFDPSINLNVPGDQTHNDDFFAGFSGILPTGTRYNMETAVARTSGDRFDSFVFGTNVLIVETNIPTQYSSSIRFGVTQPLLRDFWIDSGRANIMLSKKDLRQSELGFEFNVMGIVRDVALAYYDLIAARDQIRVQQQAVDLAEQFAREQRRRVEVGTAAPLDEKQAESQAATARADLIRARFNAEASENVFKRLISADFVGLDNTRIVPAEQLMAVYQAINMIESRFNGLTLRPDYNQTKIDIEKADIRLEFNRNQLFPTLNLGLTYGRNGVAGTLGDSYAQIGEARYNQYGGAVILNFPLTFRSERNNYKIAKVDKQTALLQLKTLEEQIIVGIDTAVKAIQSAYAATSSTREARVYAEAALEAEQKRFDNGKSTAFQVLEMQKNLTDASAAEINALAAYNRALHQLYFSEGTTLQRAKIQLDFK